jgi:ribosomal protein L29
MTDEKLTSEVKALRGQLFSLRSQTVTEKVEDNSQFRKIRRDIARLLQVQGERGRAASATAAKPAKTERTEKTSGRKPAAPKKSKAPAKTAKAPAKAPAKAKN